MKIYIITDTHFGHDKLIEYGRPKDFEHKIKKGLLELQSIDLLIHLGDVCIGNDKENNNWFKNIKCKRVLVKGNHDRKSNTYYMNNGWDLCCERFDFEIYGKKICFSHIPVAWDGYFDLNIHGHFHNTDGRRKGEVWDILSGYNKLVAMEYSNYKPVNLKTIVK